MRIVRRAEWGARAPTSRSMMRGPYKGYVQHYCVDTDTEALTADGWKRHDEIVPGDLLLTLNVNTGLSEWQPASAVNTFPAMRRRMLSFEGRLHSSLTTEDHRWPVEWKTRIDGGTVWKRRVTTSAELRTNDRVLTVAPSADLPSEPKYADALVELVAWFWTEGSIDSRTGSIKLGQSHRVNAGYVARIRAALTAVFGACRDVLPSHGRDVCWREYLDDDMTLFPLSRSASVVLNELAPAKVPTASFVRSLTASQLALFIDTSVAADGWRNGRTRMLSQRRRESLDVVQMACAMLGLTTRIYRSESIDMWVLSISDSPKARRVDVARWGAWVDHDGIVWCPTTPNGTWLARRNGSVFFTGNSTGEELGVSDTAQWVRNIQNYHMDTRGWADIGYNFLADREGTIYEGRGWDVHGAHTGAWNPYYHGVCFLGDDDPDYNDAPPAARRALRRLRDELVRRHPEATDLKGHRDQKATSCPGDELYAWVHAGMPVDDEKEDEVYVDLGPENNTAAKAVNVPLFGETELVLATDRGEARVRVATGSAVHGWDIREVEVPWGRTLTVPVRKPAELANLEYKGGTTRVGVRVR